MLLNQEEIDRRNAAIKARADRYEEVRSLRGAPHSGIANRLNHVGLGKIRGLVGRLARDRRLTATQFYRVT